jgi:hypothetical protein
LSGYSPAKLIINRKATKTTIDLLIPTAYSDNRSNDLQINKTSGGWFISKPIKNPVSVNLSGYMLDTKDVQERHAFLENYKQYIEARKDSGLDYSSDTSSIELEIEGRIYFGYMQAINLQKSSVQQFLYQYNMSFIFLSDKLVYNPTNALSNADTTMNVYISENKEIYIGETMFTILKGE